MGEYVCMSSDIDVSPAINLESLVAVLPSLREVFDVSLQTYQSTNKYGNPITAVSLKIYGDGNWHEDEVVNALAVVAPFVKEGSELYCNGDFDKWLYELVDGKFVLREGETYYSTDLDETAQYKITRQGITIGLSDEELNEIYRYIAAGKIHADLEDKEE